jgi:hypothetical protein
MTVLTPFAEVEASMAADVLALLANAAATVIEPPEAAGREFAVIFDAAYIAPLEIDSVGPAASALDADVVGLEQESVVAIRCKHYEIRRLEPDGAGVTLMRLREVS